MKAEGRRQKAAKQSAVGSRQSARDAGPTTDHRPPITDSHSKLKTQNSKLKTPLVYIAYPNSLNLRSANALQTFATLRELRARQPDMIAFVPRRDRTPSRFGEVGAIHLLCPPVGKLSRLYRSTLPYYAERSVFALVCAVVLWLRGWRGGVVYVRDAICAVWWCALLGPLFGAHVIYEAHDLESRNPSRAKERWAQGVLNLLDRLALTRASALVSLTADFRYYLEQIGWRKPDDVFVIPDAYDQTLFAPQDREACRAELSIPADAELVVYAGMTFAYRWLEGLLEAATRLAPDHPHLLLALVGGRPAEVATLKERADELGLRVVDSLDATPILGNQPSVVFTGQIPQERVLRYLGAADVFAIPDTLTDITASPLKLFEYLALGQPLVLPDLPALHEIVPSELGFFFSRRNVDKLTAALAAALHSPAGNQARRAVAADHTYARRAERILEVIDRVTKDKMTR